ncbi:MAG: MFS transporter [Nitrososphaerales archaeon]
MSPQEGIRSKMESGKNSDGLFNLRFGTASIITFLHFVAGFMAIPVLPVLATELGASIFDVGVIRSGYFVLAAFLSIPLGRFSDILGRKVLIGMGLGLAMVSSLAIFFSNSVIELLIFFSLGGLGAAAFAPAMDSYIGDILPRRKMTTGYGWYQTSMQLGMVVGPVLGGVIAAAFSLRMSFLAAAFLSLIGLSLALFSISRKTEGGPLAGFSVRQLIKTRPTIIALAGWFLILGMAFVRGPFDFLFPLYGREIGMDIVTIGLLFALPASIGLMARIPIAYLADRLGKRDTFVVFGSLSFFLPAVIIYALTDILSLSILLVFVGLGAATFSTAVMARVAEGVGASERGFAMGGSNMMRFGGFTIGSLMIGASVDNFGFFYGFLPAAVVAALGVLTYIMLVRRRK